jgi:hypothetical protein
MYLFFFRIKERFKRRQTSIGESKSFTKINKEDLRGGMAMWLSELDEYKGDGHWEIQAMEVSFIK